MIRLFLDDTRPTPEGWTLARTVTEAKELLQNNTVSAISLDHDLGNEDGMQLVDWMLRSNNVPAEIIIHSWNPIGIMRTPGGLALDGDAAVRFRLDGDRLLVAGAPCAGPGR